MIIPDVDAYSQFWEIMPEKLNTELYSICGVAYDCSEKKFKIGFFEIVDEHSSVIRSFEEGYYPPELHNSILEGCMKVQDYIESKKEKEEFTHYDYLAEKADKEEWRDFE